MLLLMVARSYLSWQQAHFHDLTWVPDEQLHGAMTEQEFERTIITDPTFQYISSAALNPPGHTEALRVMAQNWTWCAL